MGYGARLKAVVALPLSLMMAAGGAASYWYVASPPQAVESLVEASKGGDESAFAKQVDISSLRNSLRTQLAYNGSQDTHIAWKTFKRDVVAAVRDPIIDAMVTPTTVAALVAQLGDRHSDGRDARSNWEIDREGLNSFTVRSDGEGGGLALEFRFRREGLQWILSEQILPTEESSLSGN